MRILLITHGWPPRAAGGVEIYSSALARALGSDPRDQVTVLAREADGSAAEYAIRRAPDRGLEVYLINRTYRDSRSFADSYRNLSVRAAAGALIERVRPDVAHIQHLTHLSTEIVLELSQRGIPLVMTLHDFWLSCQRGQLLDRAYRRCPGPTPDRCAPCLGLTSVGAVGVEAAGPQGLLGRAPSPLGAPVRRAASAALHRIPVPRRVARRAAARREAHVRAVMQRVDLFLAPSRTVRDHFVDQGVAPSKIVHCPYGHDHAPFSGLTRTRGHRLRVGFVGSLMISKAPHLLLEAFAGLPAGAASVHLYGAVAPYHGDHGYAARLRPLLAAPGVHHAGPLPHAAIPRALTGLDALVVPSIWLENAPIVISEAHLAGVPVVASELGGMAEMVRHEHDGLLFSPGDAGALRAALLRLIDEPGLLARLSANVPAVPTMEAHAEELRARYAGLVPARRGGGLIAVIVNHETPDRTVRAARSVLASDDVDGLVVVDNGGRDAERLSRELPRAEVVTARVNLGFAGGANLGLRAAMRRGARALLLVNSDARLEADCAARLMRALERRDAGIVGPALLHDPDVDRIESVGIRLVATTARMRMLGFGGSWSSLAHREPREVDAISGCVMLVRREVLETVGLFDEAFFFSFEDIDLCLRARARGYRSVCAPAARAYHLGAGTIGKGSPDRRYYAARNHLLLGRRLGGGGAALRQSFIVGANLAAAVAAAGAGAPGAQVGAALRGIADHWLGRYGQRGRPV